MSRDLDREIAETRALLAHLSVVDLISVLQGPYGGPWSRLLDELIRRELLRREFSVGAASGSGA